MAFIVTQVIVQDQVLDAALLFTLSFLFAFHRYGEGRIGRQVDCTCLFTFVRDVTIERRGVKKY